MATTNRLALHRGSSSKFRTVGRGGANRLMFGSNNTAILRPIESGVSRLPRALTINSQTVFPTFWYNGSDATASTWVAEYGSNMSIINTGTAPTFVNGPFFDSTRQVKFADSGKNYGANNVTSIGTDDFVFEFIVNTTSDTTIYRYIMYGTTGTAWWYLRREQTSGNLYFLIYDGSTAQAVAFANITQNAIYHIMIFGDRSGSMIMYCNAVASTAGGISTIGNVGATANLYTGTSAGSQGNSILQAAMWKGASWLDSHLQPAIVQERFHRLFGTHLHMHRGQGYPSTCSRSTSAFMERYDDATNRTYSFLLGANVPQVERVKWFDGNVIDGLRGEKDHTNTCTYSEDPSSLTLTGLTQPGNTKKSTRIDHPLKGLYAATGAAATREVTFSTSPAGADVHCLSARIVPGDKTWVRLESIVSGAALWQNFQLTGNGAEGNTGDTGGNILNSGIRASLNEDDETEYHIFIAYAGVLGAHTHRIVFMDSDDTAASPTATGANAYVGYVGGINHVHETEWPLSDVITSGGSGTVNELDITYKGDDGNVANTRTGSLQMEVQITQHRNISTVSETFLSMNDGGAAGDRMEVFCPSNNNLLSEVFNSAETGNNSNASTTALASSTNHKIAKSWSDTTDTNKVLLNGSDQGGLALTGERAPDGIDRVVINNNNGASSSPILTWLRSLIIRSR